jgi:uncharacterized protein (UPF0179 family)
VTLVGATWAIEGEVFYYYGPNTAECRGCKMQSVCFSPEAGKWYRITGIRDTKNPCRLHYEGVIAVDYEEVEEQG